MTREVTKLDAPPDARLERAHYQLQRSLYFTDSVSLDGATAFFADGITEPEWNHAASLETGDAAETRALLRRIESLFRERGMPPAVEVGPASSAPDLSRLLVARGFERRYRYAWLVADQMPADSEPIGVPADVEVRPVRSRSDAEAGFGVLQAAYSGQLEPGYARAFGEFESTSSDAEVVHHIAWIDTEPVAVGSSIRGMGDDSRGLTGLYNLAVRPRWRGRGLGLLMTRLRAHEARRLGHRLILQTERMKLDAWRRRLGFRLAFHSEGWVRAA